MALHVEESTAQPGLSAVGGKGLEQVLGAESPAAEQVLRSLNPPNQRQLQRSLRELVEVGEREQVPPLALVPGRSCSGNGGSHKVHHALSLKALGAFSC